MIPKNIDSCSGHLDTIQGVLEYLDARGISQQMQADLGIKYLTYLEAITPEWGFGKQATSPDGVIAFPVSEGVAIARNFYISSASQIQHLQAIQQRQSQGSDKISKVPKYILPAGDRTKGLVYDPYKRLHPASDKSVLFGTEDVIGVVKAAERGFRVVSTFGVWLTTNQELQSKTKPRLIGKFDHFLADPDALEKGSVYAALLRTGFTLDCKIGCFPAQGCRTKVGFDEWLDLHPGATEAELKQLVLEQACDPITWLEKTLPNLNNILEKQGYSRTKAAQLAAGVRQAAKNEVQKHYSVEDLRASGIYDQVFKPMGTTLKELKSTETQFKNQYQKDYYSVLDSVGDTLRFNEVTKRVELEGRLFPTDKVRPLLLVDRGLNLKTAKEGLVEIIYNIAHVNGYNPVQEYLKEVFQRYSHEIGRLQQVSGQLATMYLKTNEPTANILLRKTLISAIARIFMPGCKVDTTTVLVGPQGNLKSTFWKTLASAPYFCDDFSDPANKDHILKLHETWFVEWSELHGLSRREITHIKQFMSTSRDLIRAPYGRSNEWMPRPSIITGTTNEAEFLSDPTGNRRWWVIECKEKIDIPAVIRDRDLIWASVMLAALWGEAWWLDSATEQVLQHEREQYLKRDVWHDAIADYLNPHGLGSRQQVSVTEILECCIQKEIGNQKALDKDRITRILQAEGYEPRQNPVKHSYLMPRVGEVSKKQRVWILREDVALQTSSKTPFQPFQPFQEGSNPYISRDSPGTALAQKIGLAVPAVPEGGQISSSWNGKDHSGTARGAVAVPEQSLIEQDFQALGTAGTAGTALSWRYETHTPIEVSNYTQEAESCDRNQGKSALAVGDIVIALRDFPGQQRSVPKGTKGEIMMPESGGLIRVQFGGVIKDVPARDLEAML